MNTVNFNTREEYIQYRKNWKDKYLILSNIIRDHKLMRKYTNQACSLALSMIGGRLYYNNISSYFRNVENNKLENVKLQKLYNKYKNSKKQLIDYQKDARNMMEELTNAKIEANKQYIAQHKNCIHNK